MRYVLLALSAICIVLCMFNIAFDYYHGHPVWLIVNAGLLVLNANTFTRSL